mgnify:CR=1 FL=1
MEKLFYSISEVAEMLGENISLVRFWTNTFEKYIKPHRTAKGNRQYTLDEIEVLKKIHFLVKDRGLTLDGVAKQLSVKDSGVSKTVKAIDSLKEIRSQLVQIKASL